jgi:hypothetical protein
MQAEDVAACSTTAGPGISLLTLGRGNAVWWVNHKQTARQERSGGYLWAPKSERSGARSLFYDNGQGADLLETRGWDDLASGVIEALYS